MNFDRIISLTPLGPLRRAGRRLVSRRSRPPLRLETLEQRIALSTDIWTGLGTNTNMTNASNWGGTAPVAGDSLVFPTGVSANSVNNDFLAGTSFNSMTLQAPFTLAGNAVTLTNGIIDNATSGLSTDSINTTMGNGAVTVGSGTSLALNGVLNGTSGLNLTGGGTLALGGNSSNLFTGPTTVGTGTLQLDKTGTGAFAIPGNLTVGGPTGTATLTDLAAGQISPTSNLSINSTGTVNTGGFNETVGSLGLTGGTLNTGSGLLTVANGTLNTTASTSTANVSGNLNLGNNPTFNVAPGMNGALDLSTNAIFPFTPGSPVPSFTKTGGGVLLFGSSSSLPQNSPVTISGGQVDVNGNLSNNPVTVSQGGTLGGIGSVGAVTSNGGTVQPGDFGNAGSGTFNVGGLTLNAGSNGTNSTLPLQLTNSNSFGQLVSSGPVALNGANLQATAGSGFSGTGGTSLGFLTNNSGSPITGNFQGLGSGQTISIPGASGLQFGANYAGGSSNQNLLLNEFNNSTVSLQPMTGPVVFGQPVNLTANVTATNSGVPTGSVTFFNGSTNLGTATISGSNAVLSNLTNLPVGSGSITARFAGDSSNASGTSAAITTQVNQANSSSFLVSSLPSTAFGQPLLLAATLSPVSPSQAVPAGTVTFFNGSTRLGSGTLNNGIATLPLTSLPVGSNSVTAVYSGNANFITSTSTAIPQSVVPESSHVLLETSSNPAAFGQPVTVAALVAGLYQAPTKAGGTVLFKVNGVPVATSNVINGVAALSLPFMNTGTTETITAQYMGDPNYVASQSPAFGESVVQAQSGTFIQPRFVRVGRAHVAQLLISVGQNFAGSAGATGQVFLRINRRFRSTLNLSQGVAVYDTSPAAARGRVFQAFYTGDTNFLPSQSRPIHWRR